MTEISPSLSQFLKTGLWAILWSTTLTVFTTFAIQANNHCLLIINGAVWMWTISIFMWLWFLAFLSFGNRGRSILVVGTVLFFAPLGNVDRFPIAVAEAGAVGHLQRLAQAARQYRNDHSAEGYPQSLPTLRSAADTDSTEKLYKIVYKSYRSSVGAPVDKFLMQAIPLWRDCGYVRSFAVTSDGRLYSTIEARAADDSDTPIE